MAGAVDAPGEVAGAGAVAGSAGEEDEGAGGGFDDGGSDREEAEVGGEDIRISLEVSVHELSVIEFRVSHS